MANYTDRQSVFDAALGKFKDYGFSLVETDGHFLELYFENKKIATYLQDTITIRLIREGCENYLESIKREQ